eukprot:CAMPEP_0176034772 /NCGR_PEP_ID=MMETSP0120_2-20121206/17191_1 /TAXON_ID=160619 /ORGANISM="Kryptoperidinium foliaceum, Strain CCMP 1326" /LENGTH=84 /DNA_ID=CAMNT_0017368115 /DNA_START=16 /DNA_END=267 /DNA_ORIENTATION=+
MACPTEAGQHRGASPRAQSTQVGRNVDAETSPGAALGYRWCYWLAWPALAPGRPRGGTEHRGEMHQATATQNLPPMRCSAAPRR